MAANTTLVDDTIIGNSAVRWWRDLCRRRDDEPERCVVSDNTASDDGGGIDTAETNLTITGGTIGGTGSVSPAEDGNTAEDDPEGVWPSSAARSHCPA